MRAAGCGLRVRSTKCEMRDASRCERVLELSAVHAYAIMQSDQVPQTLAAAILQRYGKIKLVMQG